MKEYERSIRANISPQEMADRLAIRELFDAYAYCADSRDVEGQISLFTPDTEFLVFMDSRNPKPTQKVEGREGLRPVFENLRTYVVTTHFNGQSSVSWENDSATGLSYCLAHHVTEEARGRTIMIASLRYLDHFVKLQDRWYFKRRKLMVDWTDSRPLGAV
jgi:uncharacterized protein YneR